MRWSASFSMILLVICSSAYTYVIELVLFLIVAAEHDRIGEIYFLLNYLNFWRNPSGFLEKCLSNFGEIEIDFW